MPSYVVGPDLLSTDCRENLTLWLSVTTDSRFHLQGADF